MWLEWSNPVAILCRAGQIKDMQENQNRRHELIRRQRRDTATALAALDRGELYHPLSQEDYRALLLRSLEEDEREIASLEGETWPEDWP